MSSETEHQIPEYTTESFDIDSFNESMCELDMNGNFDEEDYKEFIEDYKDNLEDFDCIPAIEQIVRNSYKCQNYYWKSINILNELIKITNYDICKSKFQEINKNLEQVIEIGKNSDQIVFNLSKLRDLEIVPNHCMREANQYCSETYSYRICMYLLFIESRKILNKLI